MGDVIEANGRIYEIKYLPVNSRIAKAMVEDGEVIIKIPKHYPEREKAHAIESLKKKVKIRLIKDPDWGRVRYPNFYDGEEVSLLGERYIIRIIENGRKARGSIKGNELILKLPNADRKRVLRLMLRLVSKAMLDKLKNRIYELNQRHFGFEVKDVKLRYAMNRWGSCNARTKRININFLALMAPSDVLNYLIIHELAHLKEPNHSHKFWELVGNACPDYKERARWLRKNGRLLGLGMPNEAKKEINILI